MSACGGSFRRTRRRDLTKLPTPTPVERVSRSINATAPRRLQHQTNQHRKGRPPPRTLRPLQVAISATPTTHPATIAEFSYNCHKGTVALTPPTRILDTWAIRDLCTPHAFQDVSYDFEGPPTRGREREHRPDRLIQQCLLNRHPLSVEGCWLGQGGD